MLIEAYRRGFGYYNVCEQKHTWTSLCELSNLKKSIYELERENQCEWFSAINVTS